MLWQPPKEVAGACDSECEIGKANVRLAGQKGGWKLSPRWRRCLSQYLADMGCLVLALEDSWGGLLGEAAVRVAGLGEATPLDGQVAFLQVCAHNFHECFHARRMMFLNFAVSACTACTVFGFEGSCGVQWRGDKAERAVARLSLQLLVSFTPAARPAALAAAAKLPRLPSPLLQQRLPAQPGSSEQERLRSAASAAGALSKQEAGPPPDVQAAEASLRPWSSSGRQPFDLLSPASVLVAEPAQAAFSVAPYSLQDAALQPHAPAVASLAEQFPGLALCAQPQATAAPWEAAARGGQAGQAGTVSGIPVVPLSALEPVLGALGSALEPLQAQQPGLGSSASPGAPPPTLEALIRQAERLREAMSQAIGAPPRRAAAAAGDTSTHALQPWPPQSSPHAAGPPQMPARGAQQPRPSMPATSVVAAAPAASVQPRQSGLPSAVADSTAAASRGHTPNEAQPSQRRRAGLEALKRPLSASTVAFGRGATAVHSRRRISRSADVSSTAARASAVLEEGGAAVNSASGSGMALRDKGMSAGMRLLTQRRAARLGQRAPAVLSDAGGAAAAGPLRQAAADDALYTTAPASHLPAGSGEASAAGSESAEAHCAGQAAVAAHAVAHSFDVTVQRAAGLQAAPGLADSLCYISYRFPGAQHYLQGRTQNTSLV
jgi:hypothetical protein